MTFFLKKYVSSSGYCSKITKAYILGLTFSLFCSFVFSYIWLFLHVMISQSFHNEHITYSI